MTIKVKLFYHSFAPAESVKELLEHDVNQWLLDKPDYHIERIWFSFQETSEGTAFFAAVVYKEHSGIEDDTARLPSPVGVIC